ncbi:MAG: hypothetical protein Q8S33_09700 [Myxococcales bacterium]|nr:hypothetical protein [Myxococcales bacterium]
MRLPAFAFTVAFVVGVVSTQSCTPAKKCTPTNCQGCCTANDTCSSGNSVDECGGSGLLCDRCVGAQLCTAGDCVGSTATGGGTGGSGGGTGGSGGGAGENEFLGTAQFLHAWDADGGRSGSELANVGVWYLDGGTPDYIRGFGNADGTFVVREVPPGEVTLRLNRNYFVTTQRRLDFDSFLGSRRDGAESATSETTLRLTIRNLEPYAPGRNSMLLFFTQNSGGFSNIEAFGVPMTAAGATSIESDINWAGVTSALGYGLPNASFGDRGFALQVRSSSADGGGESTIIRSGEFPPVTLVNGGSADAVTDLVVAQRQLIPVNFDAAAFRALRGSFGRDIAVATLGAQLIASPAPAPLRFVSQGAVTLTTRFAPESSPPTSLDVPTGAVPASWGRVVVSYFSVEQPRTIVDGGTPARYAGGLTAYEVGEQVPSTFSPRLTAVRGPQIATRNFIEDQTGVGTTPTLAWTAPTTGTVTTYRVRIARVLANGTAPENFAIYTTNPAVTLPPGILVTGSAYVFALDSISFGQPGWFTLPALFSTVLSGVIRP